MAKDTLVKTVKSKKMTIKEDLGMKKTIADYTKLLEAPQEETYRFEEKGDILIKYSVSRITSNIYINDERTMIIADSVTTIWISSYERDKNGNPKSFIAKKKDLVKKDSFRIPLKEVTLQELEAIRKLQKNKKWYSTLFLFKEYGRYYLAQLKYDISLMTTNIYDDVHMCRECTHLSALPDKMGGCKKVRNCWKRLEKYPFIDVGYQTIKKISFNTDGTPTCSSEVFDVCKCENFEPYGERSNGPKKLMDKMALRNSLKEFIKDFN